MQAKKTRILIIEDEDAIKEMIKMALEAEPFDLVEAPDTKCADRCIAQAIPQLILLDWMLPGQSGIEYIKKLRKNPITENIPIILLTAKAEEENKIKGLDVGADDYIIKPFSPRELLSRIKVILRRGPLLNMDGLIKVEDLLFNTKTHQVTIKSELLPLTVKTYELLYFFIRHKGQTVSRGQLLSHVWGDEKDVTDRTVDVHVRRLRKILEPYGYESLIETVHGVGYKFKTHHSPL
ncbi:MAG: phoB [Gammaproteobacteria bacterium]|nr:phoB [Gammaproteobacteria bacterium]